MKYTHIGIEDRARAVSQLTWNEGGNDKEDVAADSEDDDEGWQRYGSGTHATNIPEPSSLGRSWPTEMESRITVSERKQAVSGNGRPCLSALGTEFVSRQDAGSIPAA